MLCLRFASKRNIQEFNLKLNVQVFTCLMQACLLNKKPGFSQARRLLCLSCTFLRISPHLAFKMCKKGLSENWIYRLTNVGCFGVFMICGCLNHLEVKTTRTIAVSEETTCHQLRKVQKALDIYKEMIGLLTIRNRYAFLKMQGIINQNSHGWSWWNHFLY